MDLRSEAVERLGLNSDFEREGYHTVCQSIVLCNADGAQTAHSLNVERCVFADTVRLGLWVGRPALAGRRQLHKRPADVFARWRDLAVGYACIVWNGRGRDQAEGGEQREYGGEGSHFEDLENWGGNGLEWSGEGQCRLGLKSERN